MKNLWHDIAAEIVAMLWAVIFSLPFQIELPKKPIIYPKIPRVPIPTHLRACVLLESKNRGQKNVKDRFSGGGILLSSAKTK